MKKLYVTLSGVLLFGAIALGASAATNSIVGKKVQSMIAFSVNGKPVKDAIVIDGTTYVPARSFAEANGATITVKKGAVEMTTTATSEDALVDQLKIKNRISVLESTVTQLEVDLKGANETIAQAQAAIDANEKMNASMGPNDPKIDSTEIKERLAAAKAQAIDIQAKIDAANAEIEQLKAQLK